MFTNEQKNYLFGLFKDYFLNIKGIQLKKTIENNGVMEEFIDEFVSKDDIAEAIANLLNDLDDNNEEIQEI